MIIPRNIAIGLVKSGLAVEVACLKPDGEGRQYIAVTRYDVQRTDRYKARDKDVERVINSDCGGPW